MRAALVALRLAWRGHKGALLAISVLTVAGGMLPVAGAWASKLLFDELSRGQQADGERALLVAVASAVAVALGGAVGYALGHLMTVAQAAIGLVAGDDLYRRVNSFVGIAPFENPSFRDRLELAQQAAEQAPFALLTFAMATAHGFVSVVGFAGVLFAVEPTVGWLLLAAALPELVIQVGLARQRARATEEATSIFRTRYMFQVLLTDVRAARELRLFGLGDLFRGRMLSALRRANGIELRAGRRTATAQSGLSVASALVLLAGTVVAVRGVLRGELTLGDVVLYLGAMASLQSGLSGIMSQLGDVGTGMRLFGNYVSLVHPREPSPGEQADGARPVEPLHTGLTFEDVWFRYTPDGPWILRGVSFTVAAGSSMGLVGVNGAGKSTLVKLACRFYDPERGRVLWDGVDLRELDVAALRRRMGAVFQDFMAYDLIASENIGLGDLRYLDDLPRIRTAAGLARIDEALERLPKAYRTMLSRSFQDDEADDGAALSGGQWQRVALARSLLREDADLLILDEPTASLDAEAAQQVSEVLRHLRRGRASLMVSHRLSALRRCDEIVVLDGGVVIENGDHDALMTLGGEYARLFELQAADYQDARVGS
ncbi:ABC transporter ATP-binding protein [Phytomonospora endophytica]|uniref:ATP-binding cassette subfamily B protein n=1 Tax=Phytomonospora endophytica TaxID=714109 RepID=A0A841FC08_9ACTN|nr:ABC transporter ATP-binding protein [Phytomonospora endophytica]MBB6032915.1 ATP-binding cassette subfamily B protein [Phytomonospora endophytica]GIG65141.1 ABC transporter [Phytomonospora endophytica]